MVAVEIDISLRQDYILVPSLVLMVVVLLSLDG